ncbi:MAG TPA: fibronectin type III domain-containing protein [Edaphobacter sp.]|nr:fibronectin type III domain-containing protein [Edaphobacter sp.]
MNRLHLKLAATAAVGLLFSNLIAAQVGSYAPKGILPPAPTAAHVRITHGPELELANAYDNSAIIRWTSNNPGGTDQHYGVVHYGPNPKELNQTAKSPNRMNRNHPDMIFRVRVEGLKPKSTYYYTVDSTQGTGKSDGVKGPVKHFATP